MPYHELSKKFQDLIDSFKQNKSWLLFGVISPITGVCYGFNVDCYMLYIRCSRRRLLPICVCQNGGLNIQGRLFDNRTLDQKVTFRRFLGRLKEDYPETRIMGHCGFAGVPKRLSLF